MHSIQVYRAVFTIVGIALFADPALARDGSERCDSALLPQISVEQLSLSERIAYLSLIDESNYDKAKTSGSLKILMPDLPVTANYSQFAEHRRTFSSQTRFTYQRNEARSVFRQSLEPYQLAAWRDCMTSTEPGVRIMLTNDDADGAAAKVSYSEGPGRKRSFVASVTGGSIAGSSRFSLDHGGSETILLKRRSQSSSIRLVVNGQGMTDSAVSLAPSITPPSQGIPEIDWDIAPSDNRFKCVANKKTIDADLDCKTYNTCGNRSANTLMCAGTFYSHAIVAEPKAHRTAIPPIVWSFRATGQTFQCTANGKDVGAVLDCTNFGTCGVMEGNRMACAGTYYRRVLAPPEQ